MPTINRRINTDTLTIEQVAGKNSGGVVYDNRATTLVFTYSDPEFVADKDVAIIFDTLDDMGVPQNYDVIDGTFQIPWAVMSRVSNNKLRYQLAFIGRESESPSVYNTRADILQVSASLADISNIGDPVVEDLASSMWAKNHAVLFPPSFETVSGKKVLRFRTAAGDESENIIDIDLDGGFATDQELSDGLATKADKTTTVNGHALSGNVTVTKADVGLGNVDNTSDAEKPISTATQAALDGVTAKIPAEATAQNKLADKAYVNQAVSTNTANFLGTYIALAKSGNPKSLGFTQAQVDDMKDPTSTAANEIATRLAGKLTEQGITPSNNDYAFVEMDFTDPETSPDESRRYKFDGSSWVYEYTLNTSSFTDPQWAAINSGLSSADKTTIDDLSSTYVAKNNVTVPVTVPTLAWGETASLGSVDGKSFQVTMPANPDTDAKTTSSDKKNTKLFLVGAEAQSSSGQTTYSNDGVYVGTDNKLYSNGSIVAIDGDVVHKTGNETIAGVKTFNQPLNAWLGVQRVGPSVGDTSKWFKIAKFTAATARVYWLEHYTSGNSPERGYIWFGIGGATYTSNRRGNAPSFKITTNTNGDHELWGRVNHTWTYMFVTVKAVSSYGGQIDNPNDNITIDTSLTQYDEPTVGDTYTEVLDGVLTTKEVTDLLDGYLPMVRTTGNQEIAGVKTFTSAPIFSHNDHNLRLSNPNLISGTIPNSDLWQTIDYTDKNGAVMGFMGVSIFSSGGNGRLRFRAYNYDRSTTASMNLCADSTGDNYVTVPARTYDTTHTDDVVTIGTLKASTDVVHRTGAEVITGAKTFYDASLGYINISGGRTNGPMGVLRFRNYQDVLVSGLYAEVDGTTAIDLLGTTKAFKVNNQRTYDALNTSDVVTIGSLQSSTDVVHTSGNETIAGTKTFTGQLKHQRQNPQFEFRDTVYDVTNTSFNDWHGAIFDYDKNGNITGLIGWIRYGDDIDHAKLRTVRPINGSNVASEVDVRLYNDGTACVLAPARPYANASSSQTASDVITKWHLERNLTISGNIVTRSSNKWGNGWNTLSNQSLTPDAWTRYAYSLVYAGDSGASENNAVAFDSVVYDGSSTQGVYARTMSTTDRRNGNTSYIAIKASTLANQSRVEAQYRPYVNAGNNDILVKAHVPDLISANVSNQQISLTSSRGVAVDSFTLNQMSGKNIVLPAGSTQYQDQSVTFSAQSPADFSDYPYMASVSVTGLTADMYATVTFSDAQVSSGQYAPFCQTVAGAVRLYAKSDVGTQTIPTISIGMDDSSAQQSMSNFVTLTGAQTVGGAKTFTRGVVITAYQAETINMTGGPRIGTNTVATQNIMRLMKNASDTDYVARDTVYQGANTRNTARLWYLQRQNSSGSGVDSTSITLGFNDAGAYVTAPYRTYNTNNTYDVVTIGSLQASTDVVHTAGNETISGEKTLSTWLTIRAGHDRANLKIHNSRFNNLASPQSEAFIQLFNDSDEYIAGLSVEQSSSNYRVVYLLIRRADGTLKKIPLGDSA